jgi:hypothetical protein
MNTSNSTRSPSAFSATSTAPRDAVCEGDTGAYVSWALHYVAIDELIGSDRCGARRLMSSRFSPTCAA